MKMKVDSYSHPHQEVKKSRVEDGDPSEDKVKENAHTSSATSQQSCRPELIDANPKCRNPHRKLEYPEQHSGTER